MSSSYFLFHPCHPQAYSKHCGLSSITNSCSSPFSRTECGSGFIAISSSKRLKLHEWHRVTLRKIGKSRITLQLDDQGVIKRDGYCLQRSKTIGSLYLGGIPDNTLQRRNIGLIDGFYGCIAKFVLNKRNIEFDSRRMSNVLGYDIGKQSRCH